MQHNERMRKARARAVEDWRLGPKQRTDALLWSQKAKGTAEQPSTRNLLEVRQRHHRLLLCLRPLLLLIPWRMLRRRRRLMRRRLLLRRRRRRQPPQRAHGRLVDQRRQVSRHEAVRRRRQVRHLVGTESVAHAAQPVECV